jgi:hypothetical protein
VRSHPKPFLFLPPKLEQLGLTKTREVGFFVVV